jgi:hypothetical protein
MTTKVIDIDRGKHVGNADPGHRNHVPDIRLDQVSLFGDMAKQG